MTDYDTHVDPERGLWIPPDLRAFDRQVVFRTPRATIQHYYRGEGRGQLEGYYGSIDETHFGDPAEMLDARNAHLAPNKVSIKPEGEEATILTVDTDPETLPDGDTLGIECDVDGCDARVAGLDDGIEMSRGVVCQDCIEYYNRHGHWPDEDPEVCSECLIDDGAVGHDCEESAADRVIVDPGKECPFCDFVAPELVTDGGTEGPNAGDHHGGEPWWIVVAKFGREDYASATVDAPDEETAAAQGERIIVSNENRMPGKIHNTRGPFPRHVPTEEREIRPKVCGGCGLKRYCGNHPPVPNQTWWRLNEEQSDEDTRVWECIQCRTWTRMPKEEVSHV